MKKYGSLSAVGIAAAASIVACGGGDPTTPGAWVDTPAVIFNRGDSTSLPTPVVIESVAGSYTISGSIVGYVGSDLTLKSNGEELLVAKGANTFQFSRPVKEQTRYEVTVEGQPDLPTQACSVSGGSGIAASTVTNVIVNCASDAKFAYLAKMSGSIERFSYDENVIDFGESLGKTQLIGLPPATNMGLAKHPYKSMVYALQTGTNEISSFLVNEKTGELRISSTKAVPAVSDAQDSQINSIGSTLIAHPNGKMLYSFDATHIYAHTLNEGGQPVATSVIDAPSGLKMFEGVLNPTGDALFANGYLGKEIHVFPVDVATGNPGPALAPKVMTWPLNRMSFQPDGKTLFTIHESGAVVYKVDSNFGLAQVDAWGGLPTGEVVSDPKGRFMLVTAASSVNAGVVTPGLRQYAPDPNSQEWTREHVAANVENPSFKLAAIDPLGKYVYMFGNDQVFGLHTGSAMRGTTPKEITGVNSGRALLLY